MFLHGSGDKHSNLQVAKYYVGYRTLEFMASGAIDLRYDDRHQKLEGAWCWTCFPGPFVHFRARKGCPRIDHRYVAVAGDQVTRWAAEGLFPSTPQPVARPERMARHFDELYEVFARGDRWGRRRACNIFERILLELADARAEGARDKPWLTRVLDAIAEPARDYDAAQLARMCDMSEVTLRRRFRAATGRSLHAYVVGARIALARRLLAEGLAPIRDIAARLGYVDVHFFTRQFRDHVGVPPAVFRASVLDRHDPPAPPPARLRQAGAPKLQPPAPTA